VFHFYKNKVKKSEKSEVVIQQLLNEKQLTQCRTSGILGEQTMTDQQTYQVEV